MKIKLCKCGCGQETNIIKKTNTRKGWIKGNYRDYMSGHHNKNRSEESIQKGLKTREKNGWFRSLKGTGKKIINCNNCRKETTNKKYCSIKCSASINVKNMIKICRKNKIGAFFDPRLKKQISSKGGKIVQKFLKENKLGLYGLTKEERILNGKKYGSKAGRIGGLVGGSKGGIRTAEILRKNKPYIWRGVNFMSKLEMNFAKEILTKPVDGINCNIKMKGGIIDFFPKEYDKKYMGIFVEFHPWDWSGLTSNEYYNKRRNILNNNGFKGYKLVVVK